MSAGGTDSSSTQGPKSESGNGREASARHASVAGLEREYARNPEGTTYVALAAAYLTQGRLTDAMVVCKQGMKAHPHAVEGKLVLARIYAAQNKHGRALETLDALVKQHPERAEVLVVRARIRAELGDEAAAVEDLKRAVDVAPRNAEAQSMLAARGIVYPEAPPTPIAPPGMVLVPVDLARSGEFPVFSSQGVVSGIHTLPPGVFPRSDSQAGLIAVPTSLPPGWSPAAPVSMRPQRLEGEEELEELARKLADEEPARGKPKSTLLFSVALLLVGCALAGLLFFRKARMEAIDRLTSEATFAFDRDTYGGYKRAATLLEEILDDHDAEHPLTLGRLAHTYAILCGEHGESALRPKLEELLARAETHAPRVSHTIAARGLTELYAGKDRQASATKARERVQPVIAEVEGQGGSAGYALLPLAIAELSLGDYEEAQRHLATLSESLPGSVRVRLWHARAAFRSGRFATAQQSFEQALRSEPKHPGALAGLSLVLLERGNLSTAEEILGAFDQLAADAPKEISRPDTALAEYTRSIILRTRGEDAKAEGAYEQAIRLDPENADLPLGLGRWLLANELGQEAIKPLEKALQLEPSRWPVLVDLAEAEMQAGNNAGAEQHLTQVLSKSPAHVPAQIGRARLLRRTKRPETESFLKELLEKYPSASVSIHLELGRYYRGEARLDEAKAALEKAVESMSNASPALQADVFLAYGRLMMDREEAGAAVASFRQASQRGSLEAYYRLADALEPAAQSGDAEARQEAKKACTRYLAAGASLRYTTQAQALCERLN